MSSYVRHQADGDVHEVGPACGDACIPVVVIDPEDGEQFERLVDLYAVESDLPVSHNGLRRALREFAAPTPPKCSSSLTVDGNHVACDRGYSPHAGWHHNGVAGIRWAGETS